MSAERSVRGYCPMGCGATLFLGLEGHVTCGYIDCPRPGAVSELLQDQESEHVVEFTPNGFTVRHPLRERLDDALLACQLHEYLHDLSGPPFALGRYRARRAKVDVTGLDGERGSIAGDWMWERVSE